MLKIGHGALIIEEFGDEKGRAKCGLEDILIESICFSFLYKLNCYDNSEFGKDLIALMCLFILLCCVEIH